MDEPVHSKTFARVVKTTHAVDFKEYHQHRPSQPALAQRRKWQDKEYREAYMEASIEQGVAWQIRLNREFRCMSQRQLADALGTRQSAISRLEDPSYGSHSLETLVKVAHVFDCALSVKFISYSQLAFESERLGEEEQCAVPYSIEMEQINASKKDSEEGDSIESAFNGWSPNILR